MIGAEKSLDHGGTPFCPASRSLVYELKAVVRLS